MESIGKYLIEKKLGQGGMGIVYKCKDPEQQRSAAVKVLPQQLAADPSFLQRFKREILTLQRLQHPNIIRVYEQGESAGACFYAMEYADGTSLEAVLDAEKQLDPLRTIGIIRGCAEALDHSHAMGIVHRDIKPANIMLIKDDGVKLMDFGIAKVLDATRMTMTQGVLGTVEYMSPEQSQGRHVDGRSDIYSLGVVMYKCLTGRLPITGSSPTDLIMKLRTQQIDPPLEWVPNLSKRLNGLIMRMLEKEPTKRVESARELLRELDRVEQQIRSGETGIKTATRERVLTTGAPAPGHPWLNPWMIGFLALAIGIGVWMAMSRGKEEAEPVAALPTSAGGEESVSARPRMMLNWARLDLRKKRYDEAEHLCNYIVNFYPESKQAQDALLMLEDIEAARKVEEARKAEEERGTLPPSPEPKVEE